METTDLTEKAATLDIGGIGALARLTGVREANIRYYEQVGVLPAPRRQSNGHRRYNKADMERALMVKNCRDLGFSIAEVRSLLQLHDSPDRPCAEARTLASSQLGKVGQKIRELRALEQKLQQYVDDCRTYCLDATVSECTIFTDLGREGDSAASGKGCCKGK